MLWANHRIHGVSKPPRRFCVFAASWSELSPFFWTLPMLWANHEDTDFTKPPRGFCVFASLRLRGLASPFFWTLPMLWTNHEDTESQSHQEAFVSSRLCGFVVKRAHSFGHFQCCGLTTKTRSSKATKRLLCLRVFAASWSSEPILLDTSPQQWTSSSQPLHSESGRSVIPSRSVPEAGGVGHIPFPP